MSALLVDGGRVFPFEPAPKSEHQLDQRHITNGTPCNGQQHLPVPEVERRGDGDGGQLGQAVAAGPNLDISQAIDDQHTKDGGGQGFAQVLYVFGRG